MYRSQLEDCDDGLKWVLSKYINNYIHFQMWLDANCTSVYILRCFLVSFIDSLCFWCKTKLTLAVLS